MIRCSFREPGAKSHFVMWNLNEYDIQYLQALLENNVEGIYKFEHVAFQQGYGPLFPCTFTAARREQKQFCCKLYL
jgi:hypothetical protein